jgi:hypothetical protein
MFSFTASGTPVEVASLARYPSCHSWHGPSLPENRTTQLYVPTTSLLTGVVVDFNTMKQ